MYLKVSGLPLYESATKKEKNKRTSSRNREKYVFSIKLKIYKLCLMKSSFSDIDSNTMSLEKLNRMSSMEG